MFCACGRKLTSTSATPWISSITDLNGKVISGICQHGYNFPSVRRAIYREYVDHMKEITPKGNQI